MHEAEKSWNRMLKLTYFGLMGIFLSVIATLFFANKAAKWIGFSTPPSYWLWVNSSLFGWLGSLLYFSRKAYVYLINGKFERIVNSLQGGPYDERSPSMLNDVTLSDRLQGRVAGYYLYLLGRHLSGLMLGPVVTLLLLGGASTVSKDMALEPSSLSLAGVYIVYLFSFVGGYTSSDMFDYLSSLGSRLKRWQDQE